jgi:hypothetical protein
MNTTRIIEALVIIHSVKSEAVATFKVDDDATDEEIEQDAKEIVLGIIGLLPVPVNDYEWNWKEKSI